MTKKLYICFDELSGYVSSKCSLTLHYIITVLFKTYKKMKKYNLFCVSINETMCHASISGPCTPDSLTRREIYENLFQSYLPQLFERLSKDFPKSSILLSIDRSFFSPFNMTFNFRKYGARLSYLREKFHILCDKIPVARVSYICYNCNFSLVFFVKDVLDNSEL